MATVEIEYCVDCGYLRRAEDVRDALQELDVIDGIDLVEGDAGIFEVRIDGDSVYQKKRFGYQLDRVVDKVEKALGVEAEG